MECEVKKSDYKKFLNKIRSLALKWPNHERPISWRICQELEGNLMGKINRNEWIEKISNEGNFELG